MSDTEALTQSEIHPESVSGSGLQARAAAVARLDAPRATRRETLHHRIHDATWGWVIQRVLISSTLVLFVGIAAKSSLPSVGEITSAWRLAAPLSNSERLIIMGALAFLFIIVAAPTFLLMHIFVRTIAGAIYLSRISFARLVRAHNNASGRPVEAHDRMLAAIQVAVAIVGYSVFSYSIITAAMTTAPQSIYWLALVLLLLSVAMVGGILWQIVGLTDQVVLLIPANERWRYKLWEPPECAICGGARSERSRWHRASTRVAYYAARANARLLLILTRIETIRFLHKHGFLGLAAFGAAWSLLLWALGIDLANATQITSYLTALAVLGFAVRGTASTIFDEMMSAWTWRRILRMATGLLAALALVRNARLLATATAAFDQWMHTNVGRGDATQAMLFLLSVEVAVVSSLFVAISRRLGFTPRATTRGVWVRSAGYLLSFGLGAFDLGWWPALIIPVWEGLQSAASRDAGAE